MMLACHKETDDAAGACYMHSDRPLDMFMHYLYVLNWNLRLEGGFPTFFNDQIRSLIISNFFTKKIISSCIRNVEVPICSNLFV